MVIFYDDDKKKSIEPISPRRKIVRIFLWISLAVVTVCVLTILLLSGLSGTNITLKKGLEEYLSGAFGMSASIGRFDYIGFFPDMRLDIGDLSMTKEKADNPSVTAGSFIFSRGFFDQMFSRARMKAFDLRDFKMDQEIMTAKSLQIDRLALVEKGPEGTPAMILSGRYGKETFEGHMDMALKGQGHKNVFVRSEEGGFSFESPFLTVKGHVQEKGMKAAKIEFDHLRMGKIDLSGHFISSSGFTGEHYNFNLNFKSGQYEVMIVSDGGEIKGRVHVKSASVDDIISIINEISSLYSLLIFSQHEESLISPDTVLRLSAKIDDLHLGNGNAGNLSFPVTIEKGVLEIGPLQGSIFGGNPGGLMRVDAVKTPAEMTMRLDVEALDFGALQKSYFDRTGGSGSANLKISLSGQAENKVREFLETLKGDIALVAGEGHFDSRLINLWGAGLLNTMMPSFKEEEDMGLNCLIAAFKVENGIGRPSPLLADTKKVTIIGDGTIDFGSDKIDLRLKPEAKDTAVVNLATSVRLTGRIGNVKVRPDTASLGITLGKLVLGTINPAYMLFSMTDLGVTERHPCHSFIGKEGQ